MEMCEAYQYMHSGIDITKYIEIEWQETMVERVDPGTVDINLTLSFDTEEQLFLINKKLSEVKRTITIGDPYFITLHGGIAIRADIKRAEVMKRPLMACLWTGEPPDMSRFDTKTEYLLKVTIRAMTKDVIYQGESMLDRSYYTGVYPGRRHG